MNHTRLSVVVVGAGHAGGTVVALLRRYGWTGRVTLVGEEPLLPYQRPPLSKAWLRGEANWDSLSLRPERFYAEQDIDLRLGTRACSIDIASRSVTLATHETLPYDRLVLALGARTRKLEVPGVGLGGILELRTTVEADRLKAALGSGKRLAVVGGGYIGLEAAASARSLGSDALVIEREDRLLARVASCPISDFFQRYHRSKGVKLELSASVTAFEGSDGQVSHVRLSDGRTIPCDTALIGIGAVANDGLAQASGLTCDDGIVVDASARTSVPRIYAIGDCTRRPLTLYQRMGRLESVQNALEQAKLAASDICRRPPPVPEVPWFWSDQFDAKLQIAGFPFESSKVVVRGDPAADRFAVFHLARDGLLQAVEAVNSPAEFMTGRMMIARRIVVNPEMLADPSRRINELIAPAQNGT